MYISEKKYDFDQLMFEVTRRCNMNCQHCLRGDSQCLDIDNIYIEHMIAYANSINSIIFTGGEPSLNVSAIRFALECCKKYHVPVGSFFVATNGKHDPRELLDAMNDWYVYCDDDDNLCEITISTDCFHESINPLHKKRLRCASYYGESKVTDWSSAYLLDEGRAKNLFGYKKMSVETHDDGVIIDDDDDIVRIESMVYVSANGEIRTNCDAAFDNTNFTIGDLSDASFNEIMMPYVEYEPYYN